MAEREAHVRFQVQMCLHMRNHPTISVVALMRELIDLCKQSHAYLCDAQSLYDLVRDELAAIVRARGPSDEVGHMLAAAHERDEAPACVASGGASVLLYNMILYGLSATADTASSLVHDVCAAIRERGQLVHATRICAWLLQRDPELRCAPRACEFLAANQPRVADELPLYLDAHTHQLLVNQLIASTRTGQRSMLRELLIVEGNSDDLMTTSPGDAVAARKFRFSLLCSMVVAVLEVELVRPEHDARVGPLCDADAAAVSALLGEPLVAPAFRAQFGAANSGVLADATRAALRYDQLHAAAPHVSVPIASLAMLLLVCATRDAHAHAQVRHQQVTELWLRNSIGARGSSPDAECDVAVYPHLLRAGVWRAGAGEHAGPTLARVHEMMCAASAIYWVCHTAWQPPLVAEELLPPGLPGHATVAGAAAAACLHLVRTAYGDSDGCADLPRLLDRLSARAATAMQLRGEAAQRAFYDDSLPAPEQMAAARAANAALVQEYGELIAARQPVDGWCVNAFRAWISELDDSRFLREAFQRNPTECNWLTQVGPFDWAWYEAWPLDAMRRELDLLAADWSSLPQRAAVEKRIAALWHSHNAAKLHTCSVRVQTQVRASASMSSHDWYHANRTAQLQLSL